MKIKQISNIAKNTKQSDNPVLLYNTIELHVPDFDKTKDFYLALGFKVIWERNPEGLKGYLVLKLENNILCFWGGNNNIYQHEYFSQFPQESKRGYGVEILHMVKNLENLYEKAQKLDCVIEPLKLKPWGVKDFRIADPWGFYIRFSDLHNVLSIENAVD